MKTINRSELATINSGSKIKMHKVIDNGVVHLWVGCGWAPEAPPTRDQKRHLHHVVDTAPKEVHRESGKKAANSRRSESSV
jgi:hypothetical protein